MPKATKSLSITEQTIIDKIYIVRGRKVMFDTDLSEMYGVETGQLKRQVRRNVERFPDDFMFELTQEEIENLRCQFGISSWGGSRYSPMVFTEQGVAMLSSVLRSPTAIEVNIQIIRVFTKMREMLLAHKDILVKLEQIEKELMKQDTKIKGNEDDIQIIFGALKELLNPPSQHRQRIGFRRKDEDI
jgi:hypothetical protein